MKKGHAVVLVAGVFLFGKLCSVGEVKVTNSYGRKVKVVLHVWDALLGKRFDFPDPNVDEKILSPGKFFYAKVLERQKKFCVEGITARRVILQRKSKIGSNLLFSVMRDTKKKGYSSSCINEDLHLVITREGTLKVEGNAAW